ncbi:unknown [Prevotella sp. CAG:5226]|nr:unknown [Prevotella sp. CAG:5226]
MRHGVYLLFFVVLQQNVRHSYTKLIGRHKQWESVYFTQKAFFTHRTSNKSCAISRM